MENVHGIAVAGGTFPATLWKLFMESAIGSSRPLDWTEPKVLPAWKPFTRGQYVIKPAPPPAPVAPPAPTPPPTAAGHGAVTQ